MTCISFMHTFLFKSDCGDLESVRLIAKFILIKSNPYRVFNFNFILTYWTLSRSAAPCSLSTPDFAVTFDRNKPQNIFFLKIKFGEYSQYYIRIVNPQYWKKNRKQKKFAEIEHDNRDICLHLKLCSSLFFACSIYPNLRYHYSTFCQKWMQILKY